MTDDQKKAIKNHIRVLEEKTLGKPGVEAPNGEQMEAICAAVEALQDWQRSTRLSFHRHIAVLTYHISHPTAGLFKDKNTVDALTAGIQALKRKVERKMEVYPIG